ncbi:MAG: hypothetical protein LBV16_01580, partial [Elusimicrobiota bacterium]|nr:hypothetical protein [Elusimicrobiota bacterium]
MTNNQTQIIFGGADPCVCPSFINGAHPSALFDVFDYPPPPPAESNNAGTIKMSPIKSTIKQILKTISKHA